VSGDGVSDLGPHLAEMDRMLRDIQVQLWPEREPPAALEPALAPPSSAPPSASPPGPPSPGSVPRIRLLGDLSASLLASMRDLLDGYERLLTETAPSIPSSLAPATERSAPQATVSAGPFASTEALRQFEQAVSALHGVREVTVRGYQGADRAIIEVRLDGPST
jgi:hypothetical protein